MNLVLIDENELFLKPVHKIDQADVEVLMENEKTFTKFLLKTRFSYQVELAKGTHRGKEEKLYNKIEAIDEIIKSLASIPEAIKNHLQKQKK